MTVCIAAIYNNKSVLGASDRMLTGPDIQFEPPASKIIGITNSIVAMTAGDIDVHTQIIDRINPIVTGRIEKDPKSWIPVVDIAKLYSTVYRQIREEKAESAILSPYGLTKDSFIARQNEMNSDFLEMLRSQLGSFEIEAIETIVAGIDSTGPHIFTISNTDVRWNDRVGFSAVGIGSNHAHSHFMLSDYAPSASEAKSLLTTHRAKKNAEVSPGVGKETDMFVIGPNPGSLNRFIPTPQLDIIKDLDGFYAKYKAKIEKLDAGDEEKIMDYLREQTQKAEEAQKSPTLEIKESDSIKTSEKTKAKTKKPQEGSAT